MTEDKASNLENEKGKNQKLVLMTEISKPGWITGCGETKSFTYEQLEFSCEHRRNAFTL